MTTARFWASPDPASSNTFASSAQRPRSSHTSRQKDRTAAPKHAAADCPTIQGFFDEETGTLSYVVWDASSRDAVIIDPLLNYDPLTSKVSTESVASVADFVQAHDLRVHYLLETHAHADHLTGARELQRWFPDSRTAIGAQIVAVQQIFKPIFNFGDDFPTDGRQFDLLLTDGQRLQAGRLPVKCLSIAGHTPACLAYLIGDALFTGDSLFMPDHGVGRCDFPGGSAETLYDSIQDKLYKLPDETRVFVGHDYRPGGRELRYQSTIGEEKMRNIHLRAVTPKREFITFREGRDRSLPPPRLMFQSLQFNLDGGVPPAAENNGVSYLKIPLHLL